MRKFPRVGDRVHLRDWENALRKRHGLSPLEHRVMCVERSEQLAIALLHPDTKRVMWYTRREIEGVV